MYGIGKIDKRGFLEMKSSATMINFSENTRQSTNGYKLAEAIAYAGNKMAKDSDLIDSVKVATFEGSPAFEVHLKHPVEPCNLQYSEYAKKYLKLKLETKDKEWAWAKPTDDRGDNFEPAIGLFVFKLFAGDDESIPIGCMAFARKSGNGYIKAHHPNVGSGGAICMGGFSGHERMIELSVRSLANMLRNEALYSSYFKPSIVDLDTKHTVVCDCKNIENTIRGINDSCTAILKKHTTMEEWL